MINVTKSYLPNIEKYKSYIDEIYKTAWLTKQGPLVQRLETTLAQYLGVKNIVLVSNGTIALEIAYRALDLKGEVITTPFSFVATTSSLVTNRLTPIFVDIDEKSFNLNPKNIEKLIKNYTFSKTYTDIVKYELNIKQDDINILNCKNVNYKILKTLKIEL